MSVANGLDALSEMASDQDWVLVHDATRPCVTPAHIVSLIEAIGDHPVGGLLAMPVADTLKRASEDQHVLATVPRDSLWQAQTPQMFRYQTLRRALRLAAEVTDEASAIEALGHMPCLVAGDITNFKVTRAPDLALAEWVLTMRGQAQ